MISGIRTPFDKATGEYQISFVLDENAEDLVVGIRIGSDDDNLSKANISEATMNGKKLPIKNDMIELKGIHNEGEKNILRVKLEEKTRRTLEVQRQSSLLLENMLKNLKTESLFILKVQMQSLSPN